MTPYRATKFFLRTLVITLTLAACHDAAHLPLTAGVPPPPVAPPPSRPALATVAKPAFVFAPTDDTAAISAFALVASTGACNVRKCNSDLEEWLGKATVDHQQAVKKGPLPVNPIGFKEEWLCKLCGALLSPSERQRGAATLHAIARSRQQSVATRAEAMQCALEQCRTGVTLQRELRSDPDPSVRALMESIGH